MPIHKCRPHQALQTILPGFVNYREPRCHSPACKSSGEDRRRDVGPQTGCAVPKEFYWYPLAPSHKQKASANAEAFRL